MHLYYYLGEDGKRVYTVAKKDPEGKPTVSAHPGTPPPTPPPLGCGMHVPPPSSPLQSEWDPKQRAPSAWVGMEAVADTAAAGV